MQPSCMTSPRRVWSSAVRTAEHRDRRERVEPANPSFEPRDIAVARNGHTVTRPGISAATAGLVGGLLCALASAAAAQTYSVSVQGSKPDLGKVVSAPSGDTVFRF